MGIAAETGTRELRDLYKTKRVSESPMLREHSPSSWGSFALGCFVTVKRSIVAAHMHLPKTRRCSPEFRGLKLALLTHLVPARATL